MVGSWWRKLRSRWTLWRLGGVSDDDFIEVGPPDYYQAVPREGGLWVWEADEPYGRALVRVQNVRWNGEEWWVDVVNLADAFGLTYVEASRPDRVIESGPWPNELHRFYEACRPVLPAGARYPDSVVRHAYEHLERLRGEWPYRVDRRPRQPRGR